MFSHGKNSIGKFKSLLLRQKRTATQRVAVLFCLRRDLNSTVTVIWRERDEPDRCQTADEGRARSEKSRSNTRGTPSPSSTTMILMCDGTHRVPRLISHTPPEKSTHLSTKTMCAFSTKSADGGRNPLSWMKSLRNEILLRKVKGGGFNFI